MSELTYVIATRKGSKRVKNKNIKKFGNSSLLEIKLKQIRRISKKAKIFLSSDCSTSLKLGLKYGAEIDKRPKKYTTDHVPMRDVYKYLASKIKTKFVCYLHVTSPFLKDSTLKNAIKYFFKNKTFDSLATVTEVKEYLWFKNKALNYNPKNHPKSQDLPAFLGINFAVNIVTAQFMKKKGRIVGEKFYPLILKHPETLDIDHQWQFDIGSILAIKKK
jgi:CMP-N-acetylneuraminic acid synthetase